MRIKYSLLIGLVILLSATGCKRQLDITPVNLRVEYLTNPIGVDVKTPRFTWEYAGTDSTFQPASYEIYLGTNPDKLERYTESYILQPFTRYYWSVTVKDQQGNASHTSKAALFETAHMAVTDWQAEWITDQHDKDFLPAPYFRKAFNLGKKIKEARAYISGVGYYELFINGQRVGDDRLDPGFTAFNKRVLFATHDITSLLQPDENVAGIVLGNGWYNIQTPAEWHFEEAPWRNRPRVLCELRITYTDGTQAIVPTDTSWRTITGPYLFNNLYSGDVYDARLEMNGWNEPGFDAMNWNPATITDSPARTIHSQLIPPIRTTETYTPDSVIQINDRRYVFHFPQNMAGVCCLKVKGQAGTRISLKYGERLGEDQCVDQRKIDFFYFSKEPDQKFQTDVFILKGTGKEEVFIPAFTYHGFQYVEVEASRPLVLNEENLTALFLHTDIKQIGNFECSHPLLNKLWKASIQAYRSNIHSIITDCPHREKNGWLNDAQNSVGFALSAFDAITLYEKWMRDVRDCQTSTGEIPSIIPTGGWGLGNGHFGPEECGSLIIPNELYNYYGDTRCMEEMYQTTLKHLDFQESVETEEGLLRGGLGDWSGWQAKPSTEFVASVYYYNMYKLMERCSALLGKDTLPYQQKAEKIKEAINKKYFHPETSTYDIDTQAALGLALYMGIVPEGYQGKVAERLHEMVQSNNYLLDFGMYGQRAVTRALAEYGYKEDVVKMILQTEMPSWGYWVEKLGSTTMAEAWSGGESLNHHFKTDISAWMMNYLAGINYDEANPGFRNVLITPYFTKELKWVKGEYKSVHGLIRSEWKRQEGGVELIVTIPLGCSGDIHLPDRIRKVKSGTHRIFIPD